MDELKKLLRRLDGLDGSKSLGKKTQQAEAQQRGYVGALRGAPVAARERDDQASPNTAPKETRTSRSAVYAAALTAALISTVTVYLMLSWQAGSPRRATGPHSPESVVPSTFDQRPSAPGGSDARGGATSPLDDLVRQAERYGTTGEAAVAPRGR